MFPEGKPVTEGTTVAPRTTTSPATRWPDIPVYTGDPKILVYNGNAWSSYDLSDFPADFLG